MTNKDLTVEIFQEDNERNTKLVADSPLDKLIEVASLKEEDVSVRLSSILITPTPTISTTYQTTRLYILPIMINLLWEMIWLPTLFAIS